MWHWGGSVPQRLVMLVVVIGAAVGMYLCARPPVAIETALHRAAIHGDVDQARHILEAGVRARDDRGWTPLHVAAYLGDLPAARALLEYQAEVNALDNTGATPLQLVDPEHHEEMVELLRRAGAG